MVFGSASSRRGRPVPPASAAPALAAAAAIPAADPAAAAAATAAAATAAAAAAAAAAIPAVVLPPPPWRLAVRVDGIGARLRAVRRKVIPTPLAALAAAPSVGVTVPFPEATGACPRGLPRTISAAGAQAVAMVVAAPAPTASVAAVG